MKTCLVGVVFFGWTVSRIENFVFALEKLLFD